MTNPIVRLAPLALLLASTLTGCAASQVDPPAGEPTDQSSAAMLITPLVSAVSVGVNDQGCAIMQPGGWVYCWTPPASGSGYTTTSVSLPSSAQSIAAGANHACAVLVDNTVWCWGKNNKGQLGNGSIIDSTTPVRVVSLDPNTNIVGSLFATRVSAHWDHTCVVTTDSRVACWGDNYAGQLAVPPPGYTSGTQWAYSTRALPVAGVVADQVAAGDSHTCASLSTGSMYCWGNNEAGELGQGYTGPIVWTPMVVSAMAPADMIAAGGSQTCARATQSHALYCWGSNFGGRMGVGNSNSYSQYIFPAEVTASSPSSIALGYYAFCGVWNNYAYCAGYNVEDELGTRPAYPSTNPWLGTLVPAASDGFRQIAAGFVTTCGINTSGHVQCIGAGNPSLVTVL